MQTNVGMICQNTANKANFSYSQSSSLNGWLCRRRYSKVYMFDEGVKKIYSTNQMCGPYLFKMFS